jgi:hypothetical protein
MQKQLQGSSEHSTSQQRAASQIQGVAEVLLSH